MSKLEVPLSPLIVQVAAEWCQPCKRARPLAEAAAWDLDVVFKHVMIEDDPELKDEYSVSSVPTFLIFDHGVELGRVDGLHTQDSFVSKFEEILGG